MSDDESVSSASSAVSLGMSSDALSSSSDFEDYSPKPKRKKLAPSTKNKALVKKVPPATPSTSKDGKGVPASPGTAVPRSAPAAGARPTAPLSSRVPPAAVPLHTAVSNGSAHPVSLPSPRAGAVAGGDITQGPPVASESAAKRLILQYLKQQNRPYSVIQVFENLHQRITKSNVQKCLDALSEPDGEQSLHCKEYGKAKIYYPNQALLPAQPSEADLRRLDASIAAAEVTLRGRAAAAVSRRRTADALSAEPEDLQIESVLAELQTRVAEKRRRLSQVQATSIDVEARDLLIEEHNHHLSLWRARRRTCLDAVDMIADGMEKSKAHVVSIVGLESDADAGVTALPTALPLPRRL